MLQWQLPPDAAAYLSLRPTGFEDSLSSEEHKQLAVFVTEMKGLL